MNYNRKGKWNAAVYLKALFVKIVADAIFLSIQAETDSSISWIRSSVAADMNSIGEQWIN